MQASRLGEGQPRRFGPAGDGGTAEPVWPRDEHLPRGHSPWTLLVAVARAAIDGSPLEPSTIAATDAAWVALAGEAEANGLAPLAHACFLPQRQAVPEAPMRQLEALVLRHRVWHQERTVALGEILRTLERASIEALVLKGAMLAWTIYPSPTWRPMSDVDILVQRGDAPSAQAAIIRLGFRPEAAPAFGRKAHHLPILCRARSGLPISVEIHVDALSRDTLASISMTNLSEPPRGFALAGTEARTLGHIDTLRNLTHHLLEPSWSGRVRLIGIVDLLRYATIYHDAIDWEHLEARYPFVPNAFGCLHHAIPLGPALARFAPPATAPIPADIGEMVRPLRLTLARGRPASAMLRDLFNPPDWWLHAYYGVPTERSLTGVRFGRHPWRVARWLGLRATGF